VPPPASATPGQAAASQPFHLDLSPLAALSASGRVSVARLARGELQLSRLEAGLAAGAGKLQLAPLSVDLFGGRIDANLSATATRAPALTVDGRIHNVDVGPMLKTLAGYDQLEGRGQLEASLQSQGSSAEQWKRSLTGRARLQLQDGALRGINIGARLREAKSLLAQVAGQKVEKNNKAEKTDFSELSATWVAQDGVIRNDDLSAKSPLLRLAGQGAVDLPAGQIDYLLKASLVGTSVGQGGRDVAELKGVTLPVRIKGGLASPVYTLDINSMLSESTKARLAEKQAVLQERARQELQQGKVELQQKAQEQLQKQLNKLLNK